MTLNLDNMPVGTNTIGDGPYRVDFCALATLAPTATLQVKLPQQIDVPSIRSVRVTDVSAARGLSAPTNIACYFRIDATEASAGTAADGSSSRIVMPGATGSVHLSRFIAVENGVRLMNPGAATVAVQVEIGA